jgi:hypothetical protein
MFSWGTVFDRIKSHGLHQISPGKGLTSGTLAWRDQRVLMAFKTGLAIPQKKFR